ncbi:MAG: HIT family protein [Cyclobacteriaceae bacterium]
MSCIFCQILDGSIPYQGIIRKWDYWTLMVSREQHTLGTMILVHHAHTERFSSISSEALQELQEVQRWAEDRLDELFSPDLYNYLQCGNAVRHLHLHMIPRYRSDRSFMSHTFTDPAFGDSVQETTEIVSEDVLEGLRGGVLKN